METGFPQQPLRVSRPPRGVWPVRFLLAKGASCGASLGVMGLCAGYLLLPSALNEASSLLLTAGLAVICCTVMRNAARRGLCFLTPVRSMRTLAGCLLQAMREADLLTTEEFQFLVCRNRGKIECVLEGGTYPQRWMFARSLGELLSPIRDPRYVFLRKATGKKRGTGAFVLSYACPAVMSEPRNAELLACRLSRVMGNVEAVDTCRPDGRAILQICKQLSYINKGGRRK